MRDEYDFSNAKRGPVVGTRPGKTRITIRIDDDVLEWFKTQVDVAGGGSYQTLINHTLRQAMLNEGGESLEEILGDMVAVAEGVRTAEAVHALAEREGVEMPIAEQVFAIVHRGKDPAEAVKELMMRDPKPEEWS